MPLKGLLSSGSGKAAKARRDAARQALSNAEKIAMLDQLEVSGLGWFWASDAEGRLTYLSPALAERLDIELDSLIGQPLTKLFEPAANERSPKPLSLILNTHKAFASMAVQAARRPEGAVLRLAGQPVFEGKRFAGFHGTGTDITEDYHREQETERLARFDSLTGLSNRHRMAHLIESTLTAFQAAKRNCAVLMLDLDRFKQVNDTMGHPAGDALLKQVAQRLERVLDNIGRCGRLGGDEFQVIIPGYGDRNALAHISKEIINSLSQPYSIDGHSVVIGASVGVALAPDDGTSSEELIRNVDLALYAAKDAGRGVHRFYAKDLHSAAEERAELEQDLREAIQTGGLCLYYQPVVY
ncbi:MAG: diguanylate cyclase, partial [Pseudomonadota bacterium]